MNIRYDMKGDESFDRVNSTREARLALLCLR